MQVELEINGTLLLSIYHLDGVEVDEITKEMILDRLSKSRYLISLNKKTICSIEDLHTVLYKFEIDVLDDVEYDFQDAF